MLFSFAPDWSRFYFFAVNTTGRFVMFDWSQGQTSSNFYANGYSNAIHRGSEPNRLSLERNGDMIWAYANGELLNIIKDDTFTGFGYVGLMVIADYNPNV